MLFRRFAAAMALLVAALASQLPEYAQQYRQRLGGAIDELAAIVARFDAEAAGQSLSRQEGIARLRTNDDPLAQNRGNDLAETAARVDRLARQRDAFRTAGPLSQYAVLAEDFDPGIARRAYADFQPAVPVTLAGLAAAAVGFVVAWLLVHLGARSFRHRKRAPLRELPPGSTAIGDADRARGDERHAEPVRARQALAEYDDTKDRH